MKKKVYVVLENFATENGATIMGIRNELDDAKRLFSEVRQKRLENMRGIWFDEDVDITRPLRQSDVMLNVHEFKDDERSLIWYDRYGDQYSLTIEEEDVL